MNPLPVRRDSRNSKGKGLLEKARRSWRAAVFLAWLAAAGGSVLGSTLFVAGVTEPFKDVTVSASVPGTIAARHFPEGAFVKEGQLVIDLDHQLEELEAARRKLVWQSKVELNAAEEQVKNLAKELQGTRELIQTTKSVSQEVLDKKELEYKQAVAERDRLSIAEDREKIEYEIAAEQLRKRQIVAPLDGYIAEIYLETGEDCRAQEPLVRIVETRQVYFISNIDAKLGYHLKEGDTVTLEIDADTQPVTFSGKIDFVSPVVDPASGLLRVKVLFPNPDRKIRPGVAGKMRLEVK